MKHVFRSIAISSVASWLVLFALIPAVLILTTSFLTYDTLHLVRFKLTFTNYISLLNVVYLKLFLRSVTLAAIVTFICLLIGYPFAYFITTLNPRMQQLCLILMILPFWTSSLIRTYAIIALLKTKGLINALLLQLHLIHHPLELLYSNTAVLIGMVYTLLPFMIMPIHANLEKFDRQLLEAATDLGASRLRILRKILIPLSLPGITAGIILVFLPAMTLFYIPVLLGGAKSMLLGNLIENQFLQLSNWPLGAATGVLLFVGICIAVTPRLVRGVYSNIHSELNGPSGQAGG